MVIKYHPEDGNPRPGLAQEARQCINKISKCNWILENEHTDPIINRVHAHTEVNGWAQYEQDPWKIMGYIVVMKAGWTDGWRDRCTDTTGHDNTLRPEWAEGNSQWQEVLLQNTRSH